MSDTIIALSTAIGEASIHVLRLSGSKARKIVDKHFQPKDPIRWLENDNYTLHLGYFSDKEGILDQILIGRMLAPSSFTGEDVYEINCHGGPLIAKKILETCLSSGAILAEPGEFTKRAFLNGKLDLIQAEAIIDLISAKTEHAARLAFSQLRGGLSEKILNLRSGIEDVLAFIEAGIDFPEDDVEDLDRVQLEQLVGKLNSDIEIILKESRTGKIIREGLTTVIVGLPNVGKSSLLNALLDEERAIVTDIPGTTRDEIRESINFAGILLQLVDTAGLRYSEDIVEQLGIERTWKALEKADLILMVTQAGSSLTKEEKDIVNKYKERVIILINKTDLYNYENISSELENYKYIPFSVKEKKGFKELEKEIQRMVFGGQALPKNQPILSNVRQIGALEKCSDLLMSAYNAIGVGMPWDIISIDVRQALQEISNMTGHNVQESLLETIFSRFCIGK